LAAPDVGRGSALRLRLERPVDLRIGITEQLAKFARNLRAGLASEGHYRKVSTGPKIDPQVSYPMSSNYGWSAQKS
jgi:hypothetical protein